LLDEIGELPLPAQAALLRVLQEHEVVPVGGSRPVKVDLRVIAATNRPLEQMAFRGTFRGDLFARLSGYRHLLTPLRDRIEDLGLLAGALLERSEVPDARDVRISPAAARRLMRHPWPLNIRELEQVLTVAVALAEGGVIEPAHLSLSPVEQTPAPPLPSAAGPGDPDALRRHLIALFEKHRGNVTYVARDMGRARMQVHRWMVRFGIDAKEYRD
jgi:transcriptional regulator with GAF, ATPase, and Fis domain